MRKYTKWTMKLCFIFPEFQKTEKGKEENIKRRKIYFLRRRQNTEKEKEDYIWRRKLYFFAEERKNEEGKRGKYLEKKIAYWRRRRRNRRRRRRRRRKIPGIGRYPMGPTKMPFEMEVLLV